MTTNDLKLIEFDSKSILIYYQINKLLKMEIRNKTLINNLCIDGNLE